MREGAGTPGPTSARVVEGRLQHALDLRDVVDIRCIQSLSFDYHQKWAKIHAMCKVTSERYSIQSASFPTDVKDVGSSALLVKQVSGGRAEYTPVLNC